MLQPILIFFLLIFSSHLFAQKRCATVEYQHLNRTLGKVFETDQQFEKAIAEKIKNRKSNLLKSRTAQGPYRIPIVVHVIHNGENYGVGRNIPDEQILSQIEVLNKDFNRQNTDAVNTPAEFAPLAGNLNIEFVLAKQDPDGQSTDGIMRINGNRNQWSLSQETQFKSLHPPAGNPDGDYTGAWPPEDYLNIWVIKLSGYLGYAQFPVSSGLPGLENENNNRLTDGVIVDYRVFGSIDAGPFNLDSQYNKGRSATHEVGHFLGLRHIWGDETGSQNVCSRDDYVEDTPNQADETFGNPSHPLADACSPAIMFQNYMDYTDDIAMNLFTMDQIDRMITVLENSPRRSSLSNSHGLLEPDPGDIDVELLEIENPVAIVCDQTPALRFTVANLSGEPVTSLRVRLTINSSVFEGEVTFTGAPFTATAQITIPSIDLAIGDNTIKIIINRINGKTDPDPSNNVLQTSVQVLNPECDTFAIYKNEAGEHVITFELNEPAPVEISLVNMTGQYVSSVYYDAILNQTIPLPLPTRMKGVYIVRLRIGTAYYSRKVYLNP